MVNFLSESKCQQVEALARLGWSLRRIQKATGVRRETAGRYLRAAGIEIRPPGCWGHGAPKAAIEVSTDLAGAPEAGKAARNPARSECEPHRVFIENSLSRGRNGVGIWQDLVDGHGFTAAYASVKRFVRKIRSSRGPEACGVIETGPGEEGQVDYADGPLVRNPETGKYRRVRLFILTLGFSRKSVRLLVWKSSSEEWARLHERAFRRLGGTTAAIVLDNLKEGVLAPDIYDPGLNPLYRDVLSHYGVVAIPHRPGDPDRKGKVESGVRHTDTKLRGMKYESLEAAQADLDDWDARWADTRIHGTTKRQVAAMFEEEKPFLKPLPIEPFRYYRHGTRTVHLDGHVEIDGAYYSVPTGWIGRLVPVRWDSLHARILDPRTEQLLVEHVRAPSGRRRTRDEDRAVGTPPGVQRLLWSADRAGREIGVLCRAIHEREGEAAVRRIQGLLSLARKHGAATVEQACREALELGVPSYRFVKRWIEHHPPVKMTLKQVDPLIRELTHYRDLIEARTKEEKP